MADTARPLNAKRAAIVAGMSIQMLDYLEREGVFERDQVRENPRSRERHKGVRRRYTFRDLVVLKAINALLERGVSVRRIRQATELFCREDRFECDRKRITFESAPVQFFATDGREIFFKRDGAELVSVLGGGQQAFMFVLDVDQVRASVDEVWPKQSERQR